VTARAREDVVPKVIFSPPQTPAQIAADARRTIAYILIVAYVLLVAATVSLPIYLYMSHRPSGPFTMGDLRDLTSAMTSVMAGLVGILGFVVGYYFKAVDEEGEAKRGPKRAKT